MWRNFRGHTVISAEGKAWKEQAAWAARAAGVRPLQGDVAVDVTLHPKLTKNGKASKARLDLDNVLKGALDCLNGVAFADDRQVVRIAACVGYPMPDGGLSILVSPNLGTTHE
jgi:crossover junction endodeoxyribonuclease RusA